LSPRLTYTGDENDSDALCTLHNTVLLPAKLRRHNGTNHPEYQDKNISFFKRKLEAL